MTKDEKEIFQKMRDLLDDAAKSISPEGTAIIAWLGLVKATIQRADSVLIENKKGKR